MHEDNSASTGETSEQYYSTSTSTAAGGFCLYPAYPQKNPMFFAVIFLGLLQLLEREVWFPVYINDISVVQEFCLVTETEKLEL